MRAAMPLDTPCCCARGGLQAELIQLPTVYIPVAACFNVGSWFTRPTMMISIKYMRVHEHMTLTIGAAVQKCRPSGTCSGEGARQQMLIIGSHSIMLIQLLTARPQ
jgi:hypothetical protein